MFIVERNHCTCHIESCNCNPWAIYNGAIKFVTLFEKEKAEIICEALNKLKEEKIECDLKTSIQTL